MTRRSRPMRSKTQLALVAALGFAALGFLLLVSVGASVSGGWRGWSFAGAGLTGIFALSLWRRWRNQGQEPWTEPGHCPTRGYGLSGLKDGVVCPECGHPC